MAPRITQGPVPLGELHLRTSWAAYLGQSRAPASYSDYSDAKSQPFSISEAPATKEQFGRGHNMKENDFSKRNLREKATSWLEEYFSQNGLILVADEQVQYTLSTEAEAAAASWHNTIVSVVSCLDTLRRYGYFGEVVRRYFFFNVRDEQSMEGDSTRRDHLITLEPNFAVKKDGTLIHINHPDDDNENVPVLKSPSKLTSVSAVKMREWFEWASGLEHEDVIRETPPHGAVVIVENKKAHSILSGAWVNYAGRGDTDYLDELGKIFFANVDKVMPQLLKYTAIVDCPYTMVTDYIDAVYLRIHSFDFTNTTNSNNKLVYEQLEKAKVDLSTAKERSQREALCDLCLMSLLEMGIDYQELDSDNDDGSGESSGRGGSGGHSGPGDGDNVAELFSDMSLDASQDADVSMDSTDSNWEGRYGVKARGQQRGAPRPRGGDES